MCGSGKDLSKSVVSAGKPRPLCSIFIPAYLQGYRGFESSLTRKERSPTELQTIHRCRPQGGNRPLNNHDPTVCFREGGTPKALSTQGQLPTKGYASQGDVKDSCRGGGREGRGRLAQLVEQLAYNEKVSGSSPLMPTSQRHLA